jgi:hypothetical protein
MLTLVDDLVRLINWRFILLPIEVECKNLPVGQSRRQQRCFYTGISPLRNPANYLAARIKRI